jgi:hypothetical protein
VSRSEERRVLQQFRDTQQLTGYRPRAPFPLDFLVVPRSQATGVATLTRCPMMPSRFFIHSQRAAQQRFLPSPPERRCSSGERR